MENRTYYYARVSSKEQNLDRQLSAFTSLGAQDREIITDKESGKDLNRPGYMALKTTILRPGDTLVVKSLDRLSRSKTDIKNELQFFKDNGIRLKVIDLPTTMTDFPKARSGSWRWSTTFSLKCWEPSRSRSVPPSGRDRQRESRQQKLRERSWAVPPSLPRRTGGSLCLLESRIYHR